MENNNLNKLLEVYADYILNESDDIDIVEEGVNHDVWYIFKEAKSRYKKVIKSAKKNFKIKNWKDARKDTKEAIAICKQCLKDIDKIDYTSGAAGLSHFLSFAKGFLLVIPTLGLYNIWDSALKSTTYEKYTGPDVRTGKITDAQYWNETRTKAVFYLKTTIEGLEEFLQKIDNTEKREKQNKKMNENANLLEMVGIEFPNRATNI